MTNQYPGQHSAVLKYYSRLLEAVKAIDAWGVSSGLDKFALDVFTSGSFCSHFHSNMVSGPNKTRLACILFFLISYAGEGVHKRS